MFDVQYTVLDALVFFVEIFILISIGLQTSSRHLSSTNDQSFYFRVLYNRKLVFRYPTKYSLISDVLCGKSQRKIKKGNSLYLKRLSREAASRDDVMELSKTFEDCLKERQVKMSGYCPIRRELYDLLFDELIRQSTIQCAERGSLLLRVRDEFRMTMDAYQKLYECGVEYGSRKANEAQFEQQKVEIKHKQLLLDVNRAEQMTKNLTAEIEAEEKLRQQSIDMRQVRHEEKMEFLKKLNRQLK
ncbi:28 kDa inner dynein arm light chain, axonemal, partial [Caerostris darwini]